MNSAFHHNFELQTHTRSCCAAFPLCPLSTQSAITDRSRVYLDASSEGQRKLAIVPFSMDLDPVAQGDLTLIAYIFGH